MALFWAAIRKDFPFFSHVHVFLQEISLFFFLVLLIHLTLCKYFANFTIDTKRKQRKTLKKLVRWDGKEIWWDKRKEERKPEN